MPAPMATSVNGNSNGPVANGNGHAPIKSSAAKSRGALKRLKAKQKGKGGSRSKSEVESASEPPTDTESEAESVSSVTTAATSVEDLSSYVIDPSDPAYSAFSSVFSHFQAQDGSAGTLQGGDKDGPAKAQVYYSDDEDDDEEDRQRAAEKAAEQDGMSRRQRKQASKLTVAELKQLVDRPEVVEWFDCDARDPRLLVNLKSYRNTVPVPAHWNAKRDYLSGKRGIEKPPYLLPPWIAETGIGEQRDAIKAKEAEQTLRQKTRERVQPKMGKIDIDYQKLHDAFFKFQTKPSMSKFGEAYYEGKELETDLRTKKPGELSDELIEALSIPPLAPPPWLIAMQRFGPPPSYPNLRIKGLNAPIPAGAQWGFHPGGWGKPPMDDFNRPLYGDVFGVLQGAEIANQDQVDRSLWGEIEQMDEESEEEESDEEEEEDQDEGPGGPSTGHAPADGLETPSGLATPSGYNSVVSTVPGGLETPDFMELRKNTRAESEDVPSGPRELYQVIPERETTSRGFMGSSTAYDVGAIGRAGGPAVLGADDGGRKRKAGDVEISIDTDEDLTQEQLRARYEASRSQGKQVYVPGADADRSGFEDVMAGEMKKRARKDDKRGKEKAEKFKF
ncbi:splicing factor 3B subunit 2 [Kwoniella heveanensis CBS 569]|nr:splicing factor 3B subunit 2 [Kwoniella heveanensis CBS 569]